MGVMGEGKRYTYERERHHAPCYFAHHSPGVSGNKVLCRVVQGHQDMRFHLVRGTKRREEAGRSMCACILTCQTPNTQGAYEQSCDGCMWVTLITWLSSMHLLSEQ